MTTKYTNWFDGSKFVPGNVGIYQRDEGSKFRIFSYWDGQCWYLNAASKEQAYTFYKLRICTTLANLDFRGLKQQWND